MSSCRWTRIRAGERGRSIGLLGTVWDMKEQQQDGVEQIDERAADSDPVASGRASAIREDIDDLLDEIDDLLEENAEEFVRNYVQKGGE